MSIYAQSFKKTLKNSKNAIFDHFWPFWRFWPFLPLWPFCPFLPFSSILIHFYHFSTIFIHFQPFLTIFVHFWLVTIRISVFWPVRGVFFKQRPQNWCSPPYFQPTEPKNWEQAQSLSTTYSRSPLLKACANEIWWSAKISFAYCRFERKVVTIQGMVDWSSNKKWMKSKTNLRQN